VRLGEFANRSANATCYGAVQIDEFPPGHSALVTVVDESPDTDQRRLYRAPAADERVLAASSYAWTYNGRTYHRATDPTPATVETHNVGAQ